MIEDLKNYHPLPASWFGGVRLELPPLRQEQQAKLMIGHDHFVKLAKPPQHFFEDPPLPPEELEPLPPSVTTAPLPTIGPQPGVHPQGPGVVPGPMGVGPPGPPMGHPPLDHHSLLLDGFKKEEKMDHMAAAAPPTGKLRLKLPVIRATDGDVRRQEA